MMYDCESSESTKEEIENGRIDVNNNHNMLLSQVTDSDIFFAKERLGLHKATPEEGVSLQVLKNYIQKKYGI